ncbi:MAG: PSD1 domain-containing protein [Candidatus Hydrogenedentes bacterium]|nr:PSD1 domain-containing protein [Candidatus Hydrogenedentota bacterium]
MGSATFKFALGLGVGCASAAFAQEDPAPLEFFEREVRPVLAEHCYGCHGPEKQKSSLRLDHIQFMLQGGEVAPALVSGDPGASRMMEAVRYQNVDFQMPPSGPLPESLVQILEQWIVLGAPWPEEPLPQVDAPEPAFDLEKRRAEHWAWQPVQPQAPPPVAGAAWPRDEADEFILAKLEAEGLQPAAPAAKNTLLRRLYFDITGLPPGPGDLEAFLADESPDAYEKVVDRLLASPAYGERWGRHWLDLVRFAETYGHEQDYPIRFAWKYRDYVIRALNDDVPYDQMIREHIAGDLLDTPRRDAQGMNESILATGFWFFHQSTHAPVDVAKDHADRIDNQIDVFTKSFQAMTVSCARCHEHKFDAISTEDYYALAGYLRSSRQRFAYLDPQGTIEKTAAEIQERRAEGDRELRSAMSQMKATGAAETDRYLRAARDLIFAEAAVTTAPEDPAAPPAPASAKLEATARAFDVIPGRLQTWVDALREAASAGADHPLAAIGRAFASVEAVPDPAADESADAPVVFEDFSAEDWGDWIADGAAFGDGPAEPGDWFPRNGHPAGHVIAQAAHSGRIALRLQGTLRSKSFTIDKDRIHIRMAGEGGRIRLVVGEYQLREFNPLLFDETLIDVNTGGALVWHTLDKGIAKFKGREAYFEIIDDSNGWVAVDEISFANGPPPARTNIADALFAMEAEAPGIDGIIDNYARLTAAALENFGAPGAHAEWLQFLIERDLIALPLDAAKLSLIDADCTALAAATPDPVRVLAMTDGTPTDNAIFLRGNHKTPGPIASRRFLHAIAGPDPDKIPSGSGRLSLAAQITDPQNPLTSRVIVNRIWRHLFGKGIVPTPDNFGVLGVPPTHPELLDYLAQDMIDSGWSIKQMIRRLVLTQTYRMDSAPADAAAEMRDPANTWLHRMPLRRLEGEAIRDALLAVAGTLDSAMYGDSVPTYLSPFMGDNRRPPVSGPMDGNRRRTVYLEVRRNYLSSMQLAFDLPLPDTTQGKRNETNIPAQALIMMNDPFVEETARAWSRAIIASDAATIEERLARLFRQAYARDPRPEEAGQLQTFLADQRREYGLRMSKEWTDEQLWTDLCHVLFMKKEFIYIG